jgi:hypothetical protein
MTRGGEESREAVAFRRILPVPRRHDESERLGSTRARMRGPTIFKCVRRVSAGDRREARL